MSIRPIESPQPLSQSKLTTRGGGDIRNPPVADLQRGALAVAEQAGMNRTTVTTAVTPARDNLVTAAEQNQPKLSQQELRDAVDLAQKIIEPHVRDMSFSIHEKSGQLIVRIIDRESQEVIRQIPGEEMLRIAENIEAMQGENLPGLLLKQEV